LRAEANSFAREVLGDHRKLDAGDGRFPRQMWRELGSWGFFGLSMPEEFGGSGLDPMTALVVCEGICEACPDNGFMFSALVQAWAVLPAVRRFGTDDRKRHYLPGLISGSVIGALAVTESDSGSDAFAMKTRAERVNGGWRLYGSKMYITNAPIADLIICFARTGDGGSVGGVSAFLVNSVNEGVDVGAPIAMQGLGTAPLGEVILEGAFVPDADVLGKPGFGLAIFNEAMEWERSYVMTVYVGMLQRQLENTCSYARQRHTFGSPISKHQLVADRLVDMRLRLETARLLLYRACWLKANGQPALAETAMAKYWIAECAVASSLEAIQIHGAYGYATEAGVERDLRDAVGARIHSGTSEMQKVMIARSMRL
jgi:alkylation response protein AidB-like acyl-CoA dehydrogenase